jgi:hypothetical protein
MLLTSFLVILRMVMTLFVWEGRTMHWYNPKTRSVEDVPAPLADEETPKMLRGDLNSEAFTTEYKRLRADGMGVGKALIFVGHNSGWCT